MNAMGMRAVLLLATCGLLGGVNAQVSEAEREALIDFYHATGGDEWIDNTGWLGEPGSECEWHGVQCASPGGDYSVWRLSLPTNNLHGELPGILEHLTGLTRLELQDNELTGEIPDSWSALENLARLVLANNDLSGPLPAQLADLELQQINLKRNRFEGSIDPAIEAMVRSGPPVLDLSDNRFSGPIPPTIEQLTWFPPLNRQSSGPRGYINLCWNDLDPPSTSIKEFLESRHLGGQLSSCMGRERLPLDPAISGSWYNPARDGEGLVQMLLDNGRMLVYWFTFEPHVGVPSFRQHWAFAVSPTLETGFSTDQLYAPIGGKFGRGEPEKLMHDWLAGWINVDRIETGLQHIQFDYVASRLAVIGLPDHNHHSVRHDQVPLTRLAGTTCDNHQPNQWISGAWYNPEANGEGFVVEVTEKGHGVVYWFTYQPDDSGRQAWMMGDGDFDGNTLVVDNLVQPSGGIFGIDSDPELVDRVPWGGLTMTFDDDLHGHVWFDSLFEEYGSNDYPIERLARPMLAECE